MELELLNHYNRNNHLNMIPKGELNWDDFHYIYNKNWEVDDTDLPYEAATQLLDCYLCLPERPDLATLFCWQAINNTYNILIKRDSSLGIITDSKGIELAINRILTKTSYVTSLKKYIEKLPDKVYHYVASYVLKSYIIDDKIGDKKYLNNAYNSFSRKFESLFSLMKESYGEAYKNISNPVIVNDRVNFGIIDERKSREIIHSFAVKLKELVNKGNTTIDTKLNPRSEMISFTEKDIVTFLMNGILYASRCNNFHGNVASRLNSSHANDQTYIMYKTLFLTEYMVLSILLNDLGVITDDNLKDIEKNVVLM